MGYPWRCWGDAWEGDSLRVFVTAGEAHAVKGQSRGDSGLWWTHTAGKDQVSDSRVVHAHPLVLS